jgi:hypothetical protein
LKVLAICIAHYKKLNLMKRFLLFLIYLLAATQTLLAQQNGPGIGEKDTIKYKIGILTGSFLPERWGEGELNIPAGHLFDGKYFRLIQFYELPSGTIREFWAAQGLQLTDYLPGNAYFAVIDAGFNLNQIKQYLRSVIEVDSRFKLDAGLFFKGIPEHAVEDGNAKLVIGYYSGLDAAMVKNDLLSRGIRVVNARDYCNQLDITVALDRVEEMVALPYIQFIGAQPGEPVLEEFDFRNSSGRANYLNTGYNGLNYNGQGETIAIGEGGALNTHIDVKGRVVAELDSGTSSHKIGVMQNAAGAGNEDPADRNHSWGASVVSAPGSPDYVSLYNTYNVLYTNHSYGIGTTPTGGYDATARAHDLRIASYPNHLVIYSSGNSGAETGYAPYAFPTWATITGPMKMSKNMLAVGALYPADGLTGFSSRGPMYDGRIIPQVVIEGNEGTSFAAPKATGIFAMLDQVYKSKNSGAIPPSSLLRAIMMNTADDLDNPGPDFKTGYGRINARRAYHVIDNSHFLAGVVSNGSTNSHTISVPANTSQVRLMIVWPDVAAAVNANPGIVNDLNMVAIDPGNTSYNPWVLDPSLPSSEAKLNTPAVRGVDNLNTIEQVTVDNPQSGDWTIEVNGFNVPSGPQTYYLTYEFLAGELQFMFPLKDHKLQSGETYHLRWDSYGGSGTFTLEYQIDGGSWVNIETGYDASSRVYPWVAPVLTGIHTIKFRVKRGALTSESDVNYIGPVPENFRITKVCSDEVTLKWSAVAGATSYKVYRLGAMYMEEVTSNITFSGNSAVLTGQSTGSSEYYGLSALTGALEGQKTVTVEKAPGDYGCAAISWTGAVSTDWFDTGNWGSGTVPTSTDNVSIPPAPANQPLIAAAGAVCGNITIENGASLSMDNTTTYTLSVFGDWTNNGTFNRGVGAVDFAGTNPYQEITGSSATNFHVLRVSKGGIGRILEVTSLITLNASANPLVITTGTFKLSSASVITPFTSSTSLTGGAGFWNNGGTVNAGAFSWTLDGAGGGALLRVSAGTVNIGTSGGNGITYLNNGTLIMEGGALNIAARFSPNSGASSGAYSQSGGTLTVFTVGSTSTARAPFELNSVVPFTMSGGAIIIRRQSSNTNGDILISSTTHNVTGGTIQIGDASTPASQTIRLNCTAPVYNLTVNATNSPTAQLFTNGLTVKNNLTISGGALNANNLNLNVGGHWTNNGTFTPGSGTVTFNGIANQDLAGATATTFNNLTMNNAAGLTLSGSVNTTVNGTLTLTDGVITTGGNKVIIHSAGSVARTSGHVFGKLQKNIATGSNVSRSFEIGDAASANYTPATLTFASVSAAGDLTAQSVSGDHPAIGSATLNASKSVNRYWSLTNSGTTFTTCDAVFNFLTADLDPSVNSSALTCGKYDAPSWTYPTVGTLTANSAEITGVTVFSDFQLAEAPCANPDVPTLSASVNPTGPGQPANLSIASGNLNGAANWQWYSGSCGGTPVGSGLSVSVSPVTTTTYYARGEGGCVATPGSCGSITITVISPSEEISGSIVWEHDGTSGVNLVTVKLTGDQTATTSTNTSGLYSFTYTSGSNFTVTPTKNINKLNGVTVADVTAIQQHVANISPLPAPFKRIAADVNKSNSITTMDATVINQALLGNPAALAQIKTSWRFVPSAYSFPNPNIPWGFPEMITLTGVSGDVPGQDFKGIKTADVVTTYANPANFGEGEPLVLRAWDQALHAGESIAVEVSAGQLEDLAAFQFALAFDPAKLQFEAIEPLSGLPLTEAHFGTFDAGSGEIRVVWSQGEGLDVAEAAPVFRLLFTALESGSKLSELLHLGQDILPAKAYNEALAESDVQWIVEGITSTNDLAANKFALTSRPNPFSGSATIEFVLPENCEATLRVFNAAGMELWRVNKACPAGNNEEILQLDASAASGILYCELVTPFGTLVHRMVAVQ